MAEKGKAAFKKTERYAPADVKLGKKLGGGTLKELVVREVPSMKVITYALAYINHDIFAGDNGRVLGYDNSHNFSHRHYFGAMTPEPFTSYEELRERFDEEWITIALAHVNKGK